MLTPGQVYRSTYTVQDQETAPGAPVLVITKPDGTPVTPAPAPGDWVQNGRDYTSTYDYTLPSAGLYGFTWSTTTPGTSRPTDWITCAEYRSILSLADAKDYLDLRDTSRDEVLLGMLNGITRLIERHVGTCITKTVTGEWVPGDVKEVIRLAEAPVTAVTSVASVYPQGPTWATDQLIVNPAAGTVRAVSLLPFWFGPWKATYTAGRAEIPPDITEGALAALYDLWATQRGVTADELEPSLEEVTAYETAVPPGWRLPPRVMQMLDGEKMPGFA